ncbi:MAG: Lin0512 family protein [Rhodobacterales bacterium]|jgi:uncharacterized protein (TIGR02058 family)|tara:strand:- start:4106 stop:4465 length:360 start_codon:yes stop_codon:yes gene_type:complete
MKRLILEMGTGNDLYGMDYTKAAKRAVEDAFRHSTLSIFQSLKLDTNKMQVCVTVGVVEPEKVDCVAVAASLPRGIATVTAVKGGQNVDDPANSRAHVIATAAVEAFYSINPADWKLSQ